MERILFRMPWELEYFVPAVAVVHDYVMQVRTRMRMAPEKLFGLCTVELGAEEQFFFSPMFPFMELTLRENEAAPPRKDWECVLDLRDAKRPLALGTQCKLPITEAWGILFGANPKLLPELGYMRMWMDVPERTDILIDGSLLCADKLTNYVVRNLSLCAGTSFVRVRRAAEQFRLLSTTKMYVGPRSGTTYLAAAMGKGLVEVCPESGFPEWFLAKPASDKYTMVRGGLDVSAETLWAVLEAVWQSTCGMNYQGVIPMAPPVSTVGLVVGK
jgi:hypothetical protein